MAEGAAEPAVWEADEDVAELDNVGAGVKEPAEPVEVVFAASPLPVAVAVMATGRKVISAGPRVVVMILETDVCDASTILGAVQTAVVVPPREQPTVTVLR